MNRLSLAATAAALLLSATSALAEPVEYVRACDQYGSGWFFLPGTEKCANVETGETRYDSETGTVYGTLEAYEKVNEGVALGMAIQGAVVDPGKTFGAAVNVGTFEGSSAVGFSGAMRLDSGVTFNGSVGVGLNAGTVAGSAGANFSW